MQNNCKYKLKISTLLNFFSNNEGFYPYAVLKSPPEYKEWIKEDALSLIALWQRANVDFSTRLTRRKAIAMLLDTSKFPLKMESNLHAWKCSLAAKICLFPGNE